MLENMYQSAPVNKLYLPRLNITKGAAELIIPVQEKFFHAAKGLHGSAYFKAADDAAYFAANSLVRDFYVYTTSFHINILRPINKGDIRALGSVVSASKNLIVAEAVLYNDKNKIIAKGSGNFMKSPVALSEEVGYKLQSDS